MTADLDTTRIVRSWLRTDEHESADRVLDTVLARLDATPQHRSLWPVRRIADVNANVKLLIAAVATHLGADAAWLIRTLRENRPVREGHELGAPRFRDESLASRFLRNERPEIPRNLLLAPVRVNGRIEALVGVERHEQGFDRGQGWSLNRLASILARDLTRREDKRLARVLDSIKENLATVRIEIT